MAREKKNKIDEKGVLISFDENKNIILKSEEDEELLCTNLTEDIIKLSEEFGSLSIQIKDYSPRSVTRKPTFTYNCTCGKQVKTQVENLRAICEDCNCEFQLKE